MNKKLLLSFGVLCLFMLYSCKKDRTIGASENKKGIITLSEARAFFETEVLRNSKLSMEIKNSKKKLSVRDMISDGKINDLLYKNPIWDKAYSKGVNNGTALAIPIHFDVKSYIRTRAEYGVDFDNLNYLLITKSHEGAYSAEWVTLYPDMEWIKGNRETYTGRIVVADWDGNIKSSYGFEKSGKISFNTVSRSSQTTILNSKSSSKSAVTEVYRAIDGKCYENIREVPDATGVTLYRKEVDCPDDNKPDFSNNGGGSADPNHPGGGGISFGGNYLPPNCNSDPNYVMPTGPAPDGKAYMPRCQAPVKEEPIVKPLLTYIPIVLPLNDRLKYPALANLLDGLYDKVKNNSKLMETLKQFSHLTESQILANLAAGKGPQINVVEGLALNNTFADYNPETGLIRIDAGTVSNVNYFSSTYATAMDVFITAVVLHEFIHFGEHTTQTFIPHQGRQDDAGYEFENKYYGGRVDFDPIKGTISYKPL